MYRTDGSANIPLFSLDLQLLRPDALVELTAPDDKDTWPNWSILLDPSYSTYFQLMKDCQEQLTSLKVTQSVEFASLQRSVNLGGHGSTTKVTRDGQTMVFKGIDFALYLICVEDNDDGSARSTFKSWANELDTLRRLPPHPNIQPLPSTLVTISKGYDTSSSADYLVRHSLHTTSLASLLCPLTTHPEASPWRSYCSHHFTFLPIPAHSLHQSQYPSNH